MDFQKFTDEVVRIKILSYKEMKKEDYEEEIRKFWGGASGKELSPSLVRKG